MNAAMLKALALDALYQVLDNRVFRILMVLVLIPILVTLVVGFREDEIVVLFGLKRWTYASIAEGLSLGRPQGEHVDFQGMVVSRMVSLFVETLGGTFGVMLSIAATAFFVPRMIEKGAADVLFHKPIPRFVVFLSRYLGGLLFVGLISLFAVVGIYLGLILVSGYHDPGILWGALTLTYLFGLVHCVSMLVGVVTRSTVAAILVTLIFFAGNGCLHQGWILKEYFVTQGAEAKAALAAGQAEKADEEDASLLEDDDQDPPLGFRVAIGILDGLHFVLPKTSDAGMITAKLRASFERGWVFEDEETRLGVLRLAGDLDETDPAAALPPVPAAAELVGEPVFAAATPDGERRLILRKRPLSQWEDEFAGRVRQRTESPRRTASELADLIRADLGLGPEDVAVEDDHLSEFSPMTDVGPLFLMTLATHLRWEDGDDAHHLMALGASRQWIAIEVVVPASTPADERAAWEREVLGTVGLRSAASQEDWYPNQLGWDAPLRYNILFSIGSSLAFAAVVLLLGAWRLARIDF